MQAKETINKMKKTPIDWEKIFAKYKQEGINIQNIQKNTTQHKKKNNTYKSSTGTLKDISKSSKD